MRSVLRILAISLTVILLVSCENSSGDENTPDEPGDIETSEYAEPDGLVRELNGPPWLYSGSQGDYRAIVITIKAVDLTYSCEPPDAGTIDPSTGIFTASDVDEITEVTIFAEYTSGDETGSKEMSVSIHPLPDGWARIWGRTRIREIFGPAVAGNGNLYVTGIFDQTCDFDPSPDSVDEYDTVLLLDCFLTCFNSDGEYLWTSTWGGTGNDMVIGVVVDHSGNAFVAGTVEELMFFGGVGEDNAYRIDGSSGGYVARFSPDGDFEWVKMWESSTGSIDVTTIGIDRSGNPHIGGLFSGDADFRPGDEVVGGVSSGMADAYITKFNSNGVHLWTSSWGGNYPERDFCYPNTLAFDGANNVYAIGQFQGELEFGPSHGFFGRENIHTSNGGSDIFLVKIENDGWSGWAKTWGGAENDFGIGLLSTSQGLYVTGSFQNIVDFDPGQGVREFESISFDEIYVPSSFLAKYSHSGGLGWVKQWGRGIGIALAVDKDENIFVTGHSEHDFVISRDEETLEYPGAAFIGKFDSAGQFIWGQAWGVLDEAGSGISLGANGNIYVAGLLSGTVYWHPEDGLVYEGTVENPSAFLMKFLPDGSW